MPLAVLGTTLGRVFMPVVSGYAASGAKDEIRGFLSKGLRAVGFVVIPLAVMFAVFRTSIIELLFQRGAFGADATYLTSTAFLFYDLGLVAVSFNTILLTIFFALQDAATPLKIVLVSTPLNAICDVVLMILFGLGGIALATSLLAMLKTVYLLRELRKKIGHLDGHKTVASLSKIGLASGLTGLVGWSISNSSGPLWCPGSKVTELLIFLMLSAITYLLACTVLRVKELRVVLELVRRKLSRHRGEDELS
jgi:putative peptidoglycan lipid II flippase